MLFLLARRAGRTRARARRSEERCAPSGARAGGGERRLLRRRGVADEHADDPRRLVARGDGAAGTGVDLEGLGARAAAPQGAERGGELGAEALERLQAALRPLELVGERLLE